MRSAKGGQNRTEVKERVEEGERDGRRTMSWRSGRPFRNNFV